MRWARVSPSNRGNLPLRFPARGVSGRVCPEYDMWWLPARIPVTAHGGSAHVKPAPVPARRQPVADGGAGFTSLTRSRRQLAYVVGAGFAVKPWKPAPTIPGAWGVGAGLPGIRYLVVARTYSGDGARWIGARKTRPRPGMASTRGGRGAGFTPLTPCRRQLTYAVGAGFAVKPWKPAPTITARRVGAGFPRRPAVIPGDTVTARGDRRT